MAFFNKKLSLNSIKQTVSGTTQKAKDSAKNINIRNTTDKLKNLSSSANTIIKESYSATKEKVGEAYDSSKNYLQNFEYEKLKDKDFYIQKGNEYTQLTSEKISLYFKSTFEIDKETSDIVNDVRNRLPVAAETIDDIFDQCKKEAIRRTISLFALGNILHDIDTSSEAKYSKLSIEYKDWYNENYLDLNNRNQNFASMQNERSEAKKTFTPLEDGYNKENVLYPFDADIEHVIAKKEIFEDFIISIGTTDKQMTDVIGSKENLIFTDESFNRSLQDTNIFEYIKKNGTPNPDNPDLIDFNIGGKIITKNKKDIDEAYQKAHEKINEKRFEAAKEVGLTVVKTGAFMAIQQVVGLIIVETIDIFIDEIKRMAQNGRFINSEGWIQNTKDSTNRIRNRLSERFEERDLWNKAKKLGIESGVSGALSVIPQIIISMLVKTPAFILSLIRESTLSIVRCVRILASNDERKLDSIKIILAGAASAVIGLYVGRAISTAISGVPLLNKFNRHITEILTGLLITAIPLAAIYIFEKNKNKFLFITSKANPEK